MFFKVVDYNGERTLEGLTKFLDTDGEYGRAAPDQVCISETATNLIFLLSFHTHTIEPFHSLTHLDHTQSTPLSCPLFEHANCDPPLNDHSE